MSTTLHQDTLNEALTVIRQRQSAVSDFSNAYVQKLLSETVDALSSEAPHADIFFQTKKEAIVSILKVMILASASSNEFPAYRGLGLEQIVKFCENYMESGVLDSRDLSFTQVFRGFSLFNS